ncbi:hypothetical protein BHE74_00008924 [Ensete ventricosum]|nr:hypothetical protein BHE74_00008924 [Ensete ventricosum]
MNLKHRSDGWGRVVCSFKLAGCLYLASSPLYILRAPTSASLLPSPYSTSNFRPPDLDLDLLGLTVVEMASVFLGLAELFLVIMLLAATSFAQAPVKPPTPAPTNPPTAAPVFPPASSPPTVSPRASPPASKSPSEAPASSPPAPPPATSSPSSISTTPSAAPTPPSTPGNGASVMAVSWIVVAGATVAVVAL